MPKMKTHKGTAKRFKLTGTGKVMHLKPVGKMMRKSRRVRHATGKMHVAAAGNVKKLKSLLGQ